MPTAGPGQPGQAHEEIADGVFALDGMAEWNLWMDLVPVAPANPGSSDVTLRNQVSDDALRGPLGDADPSGDVTTADASVLGDADEHVPVVGQEGPRRPRRSLAHRSASRLAGFMSRESYLEGDCQGTRNVPVLDERLVVLGASGEIGEVPSKLELDFLCVRCRARVPR